MTTALLTPARTGTGRPSGASLWRKQLLPVGEIDYKGRKIAFTRDYLAGLVKAFGARAYDQVPFQLAPHGNEHTNDPERFRGHVTGLELTADGLDVIVAATGDGSKVLAANPGLGISARIVEDYQRADGKFFPAAVQHVLGTLDPRIPGMRPWQAIENASDAAEVIDLTGYNYQPTATEGPGMAFTQEQEARLAKLLDLPDDKFDALLTGPEDPGELSDGELEKLLAELEDEPAEGEAATEESTEEATEPAEQAREPAAAGASLSSDAQAAIDLANARADENEAALARMRSQLDAAAYEKERRRFAESFGIPPSITDLARPLLEGEGRVVDLANGKSADAGAIVRAVLEQVGKTVRMLDLSAEAGTGHDGGSDADAREAAAARRADLVQRTREAMRI